MSLDLSWQESANCATTDPDLFFDEEAIRLWRLRDICAACPVLAQCKATQAVIEANMAATDIFGFVGGQSSLERKTERRMRAAATA